MSNSINDELSLFNFDGQEEYVSGGMIYLPNDVIRGKRGVRTVKYTTKDGKERHKKATKPSDKKIEDTMIEIFSNKNEKSKIDYKSLLTKVKTELEEEFEKYGVVESKENSKAENNKIKEMREIALNSKVKNAVSEHIPKTIEIDIKEFIKRTGIPRIQNRFDEALSVLHEASGKMTDSWNEPVINKDYTKINYDIVYGSIVPTFRVRLKDSIKEFVDPREIDSLEKLKELKIKNKASHVEKLILEIDRTAVLNILGIGLWNKKGHTRSLRKNRNSFGKSVAFDLDFLARSIVDVPYIKSLTHFTFEQFKKSLSSEHYKTWEAFKKSVLVPAIEEVNRNTELEVSYALVPNQKNWTHIHLKVKYKTDSLGEGVSSKFGFDPLAYFIAVQHKYFMKNNLTGSFGGFVQYVQSLVYGSNDDDIIYGKSLAQWKEYSLEAYNVENQILDIVLDTPTILSDRSLVYDEQRMVLVKINKKESANEVEYDEEGVEIIEKNKPLSDTCYIRTHKYKVQDPITSLKYIAEYIQTDSEYHEKASIFDYIPFQFATLDGKWKKIDTLEHYIALKDSIRSAVYKKKKSYFRFNELDENNIEVVNEMKKEMFLIHMERENFKEIDTRFKELLMSAES